MAARENANGDIKRSGKPSAKQVSVGGVDDAAFVGYVNLNLSDREKAEWAGWCKAAEVWDAFHDQVTRGVNISVKRQRKTGDYLASATQRDPASPNAGLVVTARGRFATDALTRVLYCLCLLDRTEKWTDTQPVADPDRW